jgi:type IV pilus assembly protein PilA
MQVCNRPSQRRGFSLVELLIVLAVIAIILSIAVPTLTSAHMGASETVVMREVQSIHQAQAQYYSQFGDYASTLAQLGPPATGVAGPQGAKLLPASLASGEKDGYVFTMTKTPGGYAVNANPKVYGKHGRRTFYADEDGVIHQNWGPEPATAASPEIK